MSGVINRAYGNISFALQLHAKAMATLQEQAATGSQINRPSDDPSSAYRVLGLDSQQRYLANYMDNIDNAMSSQEMTSSILQNMSETLTDTIVHLTQISSGTYGDGESGQQARNRVAAEINDVLEQMVSSSNTKYIDQYLFGGDNTSTVPYCFERVNGDIISVSYQGSTDGRNMEIAPGVNSYITYAGDDMFRLDRRSTPEFYGTTGASAGTGTSSVKNDVWLTVTHDGSNYRLSLDGGTTETIVPSSGDITNIAVTNADGDVLYVNAANITTTGTENVRIPGTEDIFNLLINIRDLMRNTHNVSDTTTQDLINKAVISLENVKNNLVEKEALIGARINFLDKLKGNLENIKFNDKQESVALQEADIAEIATQLARRQTLYEMSLSVAGKLMSMSLLDFIR